MWNWPLRAESIPPLIPAEHIPRWSNLSWRNSKRDKFCLGLSFVMNIALGLTVRSFLKAWGKAEPSSACSASPPEHQANAVEGILFQECLKLCGFAWVSLGVFRFIELAGHFKEPRPQQQRFCVPSKRRHLGRLARAKLSSAFAHSPWETDTQKTRALKLIRLVSAGKRFSLMARSKWSEVYAAPISFLSGFPLTKQIWVTCLSGFFKLFAFNLI